MLDSVAERTVSTLLRATEPRTSAEIAREIGMSESSVRHKMPAARAFIEGRGLALRSARGRGYWIEGEPACRSELAAALEAARDRTVSYSYRRDCILTTLLASEGPVTLQELADDAGVGRATLSADLDTLEKWLVPLGIELVRSRNAGVSLVGEESAFREALIESRHQLALEGVAHHARPDDLDYRVTGTFYDYFRAFYGDEGKLRRLLDELLAAEKGLGARFEDTPFLRIFEHIALMCDRERAHAVGTCKKFPFFLAQKQGFSQGAEPCLPRAARTAAEKVVRELAPATPALEYETELLGGLFALYGAFDFDVPNAFDRTLVEAYAKMLCTAVGAPPACSGEIAERLSRVLARKAYQEDYRAITDKYLARDIKRSHPRLFGAACLCARLLAAFPGCPREGLPLAGGDLAYVTMLMDNILSEARHPVQATFVTSFDEDTARYFTHKLERGVAGLEVARTVDIRDVQNFDLSKPELAVTTVLLDDPYALKVSRRVDDADIARVQRAVDAVLRDRERVERRGSSLFTKPLVLLDCTGKRKETVIEQGCSLMYERGFVDEGFYDCVLAGEKVAASSMGLGVAVPCAVDGSVRRSAVAVIRMRRPIYWGGGEHVDVVFLFAVTTRRGRRVESVPAELRALLATPVLERIRTAADEREVRAALRDADMFKEPRSGVPSPSVRIEGER